MQEIKLLYDVQRVEKDGKHFYAVNGENVYFPGVTTVCGVINKHFLAPWASKMTAEYTKALLGKVRETGLPINEVCDDRFLELLFNRSKKQHILHRDRAANIGTIAHEAMEDLIQGKPLAANLDERIKSVIAGFVNFDAIKKLRIIKGDTKLIHLEHGYGGSLDAIGVDSNGKLVVIDWKTSNQMADEYALQVAAYCHGLRFTAGLDYTPEAIIVRFEKTKPRIEVAKVRDVEGSFQTFLAALQIYKWQQQIPYEWTKIFKFQPIPKRKKERVNA